MDVIAGKILHKLAFVMRGDTKGQGGKWEGGIGREGTELEREMERLFEPTLDKLSAC